MKHIITVALTVFSIASCTGDNRRTRTVKIEDDNKTVKIVDDGNTMRIMAAINNLREPVNYDRSFDVRAMSEVQKEKLKDHILDSLYLIR